MSSVIDGLNNAPLSAVARGISAAVTAGALALGMLAGNTLGAGLGLRYEPDATSVPILVSVTGAALGMTGLAIAWDIPRRALPPTPAMGSAGWLVVAFLAQRGSGSGWAVYVMAATVVGVIQRQPQPARPPPPASTSVWPSCPLVPGFTLYQAMLALAQGESGATSALGQVGLISLAIAIGVAVGIALGRNLIRGRRVLVKHLPAASPASPRPGPRGPNTPGPR